LTGGIALAKNKSGGKDKINKSAAISKSRPERRGREEDSERKKQTRQKLEYLLLFLMTLIVALVLLIGPFFRGLFFPRELLYANALIFALLIIWGFFRILIKDGRLFSSPLEICLAVLTAAYFVSFFVAVHKRDALTEVLKTASYVVIYLVALDVGRHFVLPWNKNKQTAKGETGAALDRVEDEQSARHPGVNLLLHIALVSAVAIAVASLGVAAGHWDFPFTYDGRRISTPIGYANTGAAYLMAAYYLAIALAPLAKKWLRSLYLAPAAVLLLTVILTFSRGAWLLLPPLGLLLVIASPPGERLRAFLYLAITALAAAPLALAADTIFQTQTPILACPVIIAAAVIAAFLGLVVDLYLSQSKKKRLVLAGLGTGLVLLVLIVTLVAPMLSPITLHTPADQSASINEVQQVIENVSAGETYRLTFDVKADYALETGLEVPEYVWGVRVLGGLPGYGYTDLLEHRADATDGWQAEEFVFQANEDATRLEVHLFNEYPGTTVTVRSVKLITEGKERNLNFFASRVLPPRFYDRIFSYSRDRNLDRRLELFAVALDVIKDYPVLGAGGRGWAAIYKGYIDYDYSSRTVHNHYLEVWIEAGIFGFLAFVGIWISFAAAFIRNCFIGRASPRRWQLWTAAFLPVAALGTHSAIDWNFTFASVGYYLFALLAAGMSMDNLPWFGKFGARQKSPERNSLPVGIVAMIVGLFLTIYSIFLIIGLHASWQSQEYVAQGNLKQAISEMEKGIYYDPFRAENYFNLSVIIEERAVRTQNPADIENMIFMSRRAHELEPFSAVYMGRYGQLLLSYVDIDAGLAYIDRTIELSPYTVNNYTLAAITRLNLAEFYVQMDAPAEAEYFLKQILVIEQQMADRFGHSRPLNFILGRTHQLLGNESAAIEYFQSVREGEQNYREAQQFLAEILGENDVKEDDEASVTE
jgi:O-antigen ligase